MLVHSLASKYERFVVLVRQMYWTPPSDHWTPPLLKSDDLFLGNQEILDPPLSKILDAPPENTSSKQSVNCQYTVFLTKMLHLFYYISFIMFLPKNTKNTKKYNLETVLSLHAQLKQK